MHLCEKVQGHFLPWSQNHEKNHAETFWGKIRNNRLSAFVQLWLWRVSGRPYNKNTLDNNSQQKKISQEAKKKTSLLVPKNCSCAVLSCFWWMAFSVRAPNTPWWSTEQKLVPCLSNELTWVVILWLLWMLSDRKHWKLIAVNAEWSKALETESDQLAERGLLPNTSRNSGSESGLRARMFPTVDNLWKQWRQTPGNFASARFGTSTCVLLSEIFETFSTKLKAQQTRQSQALQRWWTSWSRIGGKCQQRPRLQQANQERSFCKWKSKNHWALRVKFKNSSVSYPYKQAWPHTNFADFAAPLPFSNIEAAVLSTRETMWRIRTSLRKWGLECWCWPTSGSAISIQRGALLTETSISGWRGAKRLSWNLRLSRHDCPASPEQYT